MIFYKTSNKNNDYSNKEFLDIKGTLSEKDAKISLAKFLYKNLGITFELLTGIKLFPFQELILRNWFKHNFSVNILSRGGSKCLDENSICLTNDGFKKLKDIQIGEYIWANNQKQKILDKTTNDEEEGLKVTTTQGYSITGKKDHRCLIYNKLTANIDYKFIKDIDPVSDLAVIRSGMECWGDEDDTNKLLLCNREHIKSVLQDTFHKNGRISQLKTGIKIECLFNTYDSAKQVQMFLLNFGIVSDIKYNNQHYITISHYKYIKVFHDKIGFIDIYKQSLLQKYIHEYTDDINKNTEKTRDNYFFAEIKSIEPINTKTIDITVDKEECYWSDGFINHNSYSVAAFCCMYCLFNKGAKIILTSNSFRATRNLIKTVEMFINSKGGTLLKQCFTHKTGALEFQKRADEMRLEINEGAIIALPLNHKLRGFRASVLVVDEALQVPEDLYKSVLVPFLAAKDNIQEQLEINQMEDQLIQQGLMKEEERTILETEKKIIVLSSASYDFDFIYRLYRNWVEKVTYESRETKEQKVKDELDELIPDSTKRSYFATRLSYQALPPELVEKEIVEEAKSGGENSASFQREYMAMFSSSSDGFFNIKRLHENTVPLGDLPCVQLKGNKDSKYILAIDPSFSASKTSDFFGMGVYLLNDEERTITQVHSYGVPGGRLQDHIKYTCYIMTHFNVIFLIADLSGDKDGFNYIETCNQSSYFTDRNLKLNFIEGDFNEDSYVEEVRKAKNSYNLSDKRIVYRQSFSKNNWLRKANEYLQSQIDRNKIKFASKLASHETMFLKAEEDTYPIIFDGQQSEESRLNTLDGWIAMQDDLIDQTKAQLALIEPRANLHGTMQFDLPPHLKNSKSPSRARKDNYTCMLLGAWGARCYWDMLNHTEARRVNTFEPRLIR